MNIDVLNNTRFVQIFSSVYKIQNGDDGFISVSCSTLGSKFSEISIDDGCRPSNRIGYLCLKCLDDKHFVLIGGENDELLELEIWRFNVEKKHWELLVNTKKPLNARRYHSATFCAKNANEVLYVFGGLQSMKVLNDLLVFVFDNGSYEYSVYQNEREEWPSERFMGTMVTTNNCIWMFGGLSLQNRALNDFWKMEHDIFDKDPSWISLVRLPPGRYGHISWNEDNAIFIAGGNGLKNQRLNDVWKFSNNEWEQTNIFLSDYPIYFCKDIGLCKISDELTLVEQKSPFVGLDSLVKKLKVIQRNLTNHIRVDEDTLEDIRSLNDKIVKQCDGLKTYAKDGKRTPIINQIIEVYSDDHLNELNSQGLNLKNQLSSNIHQIINDLPDITIENNHKSNIKLCLMNQKILMKYKHNDLKYQKMKNDLEFEINTYNEQVKKLEEKCQNKKILEVDASDYSTFDLFSSTLTQQEQQKSLSLYHGLQLREYQLLQSEVNEIQKEINKIERKQKKYLEISNIFSNLLINKLIKSNNCQEKLETWNKNLNDIEKDHQYIKSFLDSMYEYNTDQNSFQTKMESTKKENICLTDQLQKSIQEIVIKKKDDLEKMYKKASQLNDNLHNQNPKDFHQEVLESLNLFNQSFQNIQQNS